MSIGEVLDTAEVIEKFYELYGFMDNQNRIDSYDPNMKIIYKDGKYFEEKYIVNPDNPEETSKVRVELNEEQYRSQFGHDQELKNREPGEMLKISNKKWKTRPRN